MYDVRIYDTTLRDGSQREGISLSVGEQVHLAHLVDRLGFAFIEAGFPESNPKDAELFRALEADPPPRALIAAFGMTRRRGVRADEDVALRVLAESFAPVATIVGKTWDLHLDKVVRVDRDENLRMIDESVAFLRARGRSASSTTPSTSSTATRPTRRTRCAACAPRSRRAPSRSSCATRTAPRCRAASRRRRATSSPSSARSPRSASTRTTTPAAPSRTASSP